MAEFEAPGIFIEEIGYAPYPIAGVPTSTAALVGQSATALDPETKTDLTGKPVLVTSLLDYERSFGRASGFGYDLHQALALFFANGGGRAFVLSVGPFGPMDPARLRGGLDALDDETESSILLAPDALRLPSDDYLAFVRDMIAGCARSRRRIALVDLHGGDADGASSAGRTALLAGFRAAIAALPQEARSYGAAYHPWLVTEAGRAPPSAAVAGIYARTDTQRGVWKPPANEVVIGASDLTDRIDETGQEEMNAPGDGLAVNAIRVFKGRGIRVWGARTLAGGTSEARYVNLRRTLIYVEQSVLRGVRPFVFEPNDAASWGRIRAVIEDFLFGLWRAGALLGIKPEQGFFARCGLGATMTQQDVDAGRLIVEIGMALLKPAEFVILRIGQQMAASNPPPP